MRRPRSFQWLATVAVPAVLASCADSRIVPEPAPAPVPPPVVAAPRPAPPPLAGDWRDWPVTPGTWRYTPGARGSMASYGLGSAPPSFTLRCEGGAMVLSRADPAPAAGAPMTVRTTSTVRALAAAPDPAMPGHVAARLPAGDALLDAMGFSRGRFVVEGGARPLVLPAWAEVLRVVEDCRR